MYPAGWDAVLYAGKSEPPERSPFVNSSVLRVGRPAFRLGSGCVGLDYYAEKSSRRAQIFLERGSVSRSSSPRKTDLG